MQPVEQYPSHPPIPKLLGVNDGDGDTEIDKAIKPAASKLVSISPVEKERELIRKKILIRLESDRTGQERFEKGDVVMVGYGVIKWIGELAAGKMSAGIEFVSRREKDDRVPGGNNGSFKDTNYFSCEDGYGLYLPYERLKRDDRFPSEKPNDLNFESPISSNEETVFNISSDNG